MTKSQKYEELKEICKQLDVKIIYEASGTKPGFAIVNGKKNIVVNRYYNLDQKIDCIAKSLREDLDISGVFIKPIIRNLIGDKGFDF